MSSSRLPVDGGSVDAGLQHIIAGVRVGSGCGTSHRHPNARGAAGASPINPVTAAAVTNDTLEE